MKILLTAFEPFGGDEKNVSLEVLNEASAPEGCTLAKLVLPVAFQKAEDRINETIDRENPDAVICFGQAGGRSCISLEKRAVNLREARIPDNDGSTPHGMPVVPQGPEEYPSALPLERLLAVLQAAGIPVELSESAGTFVCNSLMYGMLHHLSETGRTIPAGFIHLPYFKEQTEGKPAGTPYIELPVLVQGITACIFDIAKAG